MASTFTSIFEEFGRGLISHYIVNKSDDKSTDDVVKEFFEKFQNEARVLETAKTASKKQTLPKPTTAQVNAVFRKERKERKEPGPETCRAYLTREKKKVRCSRRHLKDGHFCKTHQRMCDEDPEKFAAETAAAAAQDQPLTSDRTAEVAARPPPPPPTKRPRAESKAGTAMSGVLSSAKKARKNNQPIEPDQVDEDAEADARPASRLPATFGMDLVEFDGKKYFVDREETVYSKKDSGELVPVGSLVRKGLTVTINFDDDDESESEAAKETEEVANNGADADAEADAELDTAVESDSINYEAAASFNDRFEFYQGALI